MHTKRVGIIKKFRTTQLTQHLFSLGKKAQSLHIQQRLYMKNNTTIKSIQSLNAWKIIAFFHTTSAPLFGFPNMFVLCVAHKNLNCVFPYTWLNCFVLWLILKKFHPICPRNTTFLYPGLKFLFHTLLIYWPRQMVVRYIEHMVIGAQNTWSQGETAQHKTNFPCGKQVGNRQNLKNGVRELQAAEVLA